MASSRARLRPGLSGMTLTPPVEVSMRAFRGETATAFLACSSRGADWSDVHAGRNDTVRCSVPRSRPQTRVTRFPWWFWLMALCTAVGTSMRRPRSHAVVSSSNPGALTCTLRCSGASRASRRRSTAGW